MNVWIAGARPRTLPAAVVPVLVGTAAAAGEAVGQGPDGLKGLVVWRAIAAAIVALAIQVGTNYANDYSDGVRGTDTADRVGPVRLVGSGLAAPAAVKRAAFGSFGVAALAGLTLAMATTWWLVPVGLVCFAAGWLYTGGPRPYGYAGLGEVFVFVFFGVVATTGAAFVQTEAVSSLALVASVPVGFLATALLAVNNLRDIPSDRVAGKHTLAVKLGDKRTRVLYTALMAGTFLAVPLVAGLGGRPLGAISLAAVLLAQRPVLHVLEGRTGPALVEVLGATGRVQLVFGVLLSIGLFVSAPGR